MVPVTLSYFMEEYIMKQRLFSMLLAFAVILGIIPSVASAASTPEEALGEVNIYSGGYSMKYLGRQWSGANTILHLFPS